MPFSLIGSVHCCALARYTHNGSTQQLIAAHALGSFMSLSLHQYISRVSVFIYQTNTLIE